MLIFSLEVSASGLLFSQHPRGSLSQHPTKTGWDMGVVYFGRGPCVDLEFHNIHGPHFL